MSITKKTDLHAKDENVVKDAEDYLQKLTVDGNNSVKYESTLSIEKEFYEFKNMFAIIGGALCITIGFIGALNFLNTVMTSMLAHHLPIAYES